jgi:4-amino-4-deoxy-L-arabinose transferase-like glycosyltransferase
VRSFRVHLAVVVAAALVARVVYVLIAAPGDPTCCDRLFYHVTANLLADGHGYIQPQAYLEHGRSLATAGHPPLYPFLLALVSLLGGTDYTWHRAIGIVVGVALVLVIGLLGRRVGGERVGIVAAAIAAVYPIFLGADGSGMSESLYGLGIAAVLLLGYRLIDRPSDARALVFGAAIGLAALTRTEALLLVLVLALPDFRRAVDGRARRALLVCAAAALVVAPWVARNWLAFDRPVALSTNFSGVLAGANCRLAYHGTDLGSWQPLCFTIPASGNEAAQAEHLSRQAVSYAADHATRLPVVIAVRLLRTWDLYQPARMTHLNEGRNPSVEKLGVAMFYVLAALALYGLLRLRRPEDHLALLLAPVVLVCLVSVLGFGNPRFRQPAEISLVVLAALSASRLMERRDAVPCRA